MESNNTRKEPYVYYNDVISKLQYGLDNNLTVNGTTDYYKIYDDFFYNYVRRGGKRSLKNGSITKEQYDNVCILYEKLKDNRNTKSNENVTQMEDTIDPFKFIRDEFGKITKYSYTVKDKYGEDVFGFIEREDMNKIFNLYTKEGVGLTQRQVYREMVDIFDVDFYTFQKILRAFEITKVSMPFAFHELEEKTVNELLEGNFRTKEKLFFKKLEGEKTKHIESNYIRLLNEHNNLNEKFKDISEWINDIYLDNIEPYEFKIINKTTEKCLVVFISDLHIGAMVTEDSLYENNYDVNEVYRRFEKIINHIYKISNEMGVLDRIMIVNLGDALDGFDNSTIRHHQHQLPQNLTNKQQFEVYIKVMKDFIAQIYDYNIAEHVDFYSVSEGNHDGINGFIANRLLEEYFKLKYPGMIAVTFEKFIDFINYGKHTLLFTHGKDGKDITRGYPLFLDDKTENKINEYLDNYFDSSLYQQNVVLIKGDLHQSANSYGKRFQYKSVGSIFGSSGWVQVNFGLTKPVCEFMILGKNDKNDILEGRIILK